MKIDVNNLLGLKAEHFLGQSVAVLGIKGSGKSNTAAVIAEELLEAGVPFCIIDIAGEYFGLKEKYKIFSVGLSVNSDLDAKLSPSSAAKCAERSYTRSVPVILDVSGFNMETRELFVKNYLEHLWELSLRLRHPYLVFVEEAHNYIPQSGTTDITPVMTQIATEGRKRGLGIVMIGQRAARIDKNVLTQADICFLHKVRHPADLRVYYELVPRKPAQVRASVSKLRIGDTLVLWGDNAQRHTIRLRTTSHGGYTPTMDDLPEERGINDVKDLIN